ncbi:MAG: 50S ribosomal protein L9 [Armatimonadota bacterium]
MKVILTEEVLGLGEPGKLVDVAPGYARNFLVPRKLAVYANEGRVKELEHNKRRLERKRQRLQVAAQSTAQRIASQAITIDAKAGPGGRLFGSVTSSDVAHAMKDQIGVEVDRRKIHLHEPIRTLGSHEVNVHLIGETRAVVTVNVVDTTHVPEAAPEAAPVAAAAPVEQPAPAEAPAPEETAE